MPIYPWKEIPEWELARIVYYVQTVSSDQYVLKRGDHLYPYDDVEENENDPVICENITAFSLTYYDGEDGEFEYWDSDSDEFEYASPSAVKIRLKIGNPPDGINLETMVSIPVKREKKAA